MNYWELKSGAAPWGDYGHILWNGLTEDENGPKVLRTGPFVPPVSFPFGSILVTEAVRNQLQTQDFAGLAFKRMAYKKVVQLDWQTWDQSASEPEHYPASGEPEDYVIAGKHAPCLVKEMPPLWALDVPVTKNLQVIGTNAFRLSRWPQTDIAREFFIHWVNDRMRQWLEANLMPWVSFERVNPV